MDSVRHHRLAPCMSEIYSLKCLLHVCCSGYAAVILLLSQGRRPFRDDSSDWRTAWPIDSWCDFTKQFDNLPPRI